MIGHNLNYVDRIPSSGVNFCLKYQSTVPPTNTADLDPGLAAPVQSLRSKMPITACGGAVPCSSDRASFKSPLILGAGAWSACTAGMLPA